jgi:hypothetical protein
MRCRLMLLLIDLMNLGLFLERPASSLIQQRRCLSFRRVSLDFLRWVYRVISLYGIASHIKV